MLQTSDVDDLSTMDMLGAVHDTKLATNDDSSVLTIVLAQRDRLKLRVGVLEEVRSLLCSCRRLYPLCFFSL